MTTAERIGADIRKNVLQKAILSDLHEASVPEALCSILNGIATRTVPRLTDLIRPGSPAYDRECDIATREIEKILAKETIKQLKAYYKI